MAGENASKERIVVSREDVIQVSFNRGTKEHVFCVVSDGIPKTYLESEVKIKLEDIQPKESA